MNLPIPTTIPTHAQMHTHANARTNARTHYRTTACTRTAACTCTHAHTHTTTRKPTHTRTPTHAHTHSPRHARATTHTKTRKRTRTHTRADGCTAGSASLIPLFPRSLRRLETPVGSAQNSRRPEELSWQPSPALDNNRSPHGVRWRGCDERNTTAAARRQRAGPSSSSADDTTHGISLSGPIPAREDKCRGAGGGPGGHEERCHRTELRRPHCTSWSSRSSPCPPALHELALGELCGRRGPALDLATQQLHWRSQF